MLFMQTQGRKSFNSQTTVLNKTPPWSSPELQFFYSFTRNIYMSSWHGSSYAPCLRFFFFFATYFVAPNGERKTHKAMCLFLLFCVLGGWPTLKGEVHLQHLFDFMRQQDLFLFKHAIARV